MLKREENIKTIKNMSGKICALILSVSVAITPSMCFTDNPKKVQTLQVPSIFAPMAGVYGENWELFKRIKSEIIFMLATIIEAREEGTPVSFMKLNACLDRMYEGRKETCKLEVISNPFIEGEETRVDVRVLEGPQKGACFRIVSTGQSISDIETDENKISVRLTHKSDLVIDRRPPVPAEPTASWEKLNLRSQTEYEKSMPHQKMLTRKPGQQPGKVKRESTYVGIHLDGRKVFVTFLVNGNRHRDVQTKEYEIPDNEDPGEGLLRLLTEKIKSEEAEQLEMEKTALLAKKKRFKMERNLLSTEIAALEAELNILKEHSLFGGKRISINKQIREKKKRRTRAELAATEKRELKLMEQKTMRIHLKIVCAVISGVKYETAEKIGSKLWRKGDIATKWILPDHGDTAERKSKFNSRVARISFRERQGYDTVNVMFDKKTREVRVHDLVSLDDYRETMDDREWQMLKYFAGTVLKEGIDPNVVFFSSTPQGGGVALMRHRVISLMRLLGVDAHWHVMKPDPKVFEITKKKMHNVFQGILDAKIKREAAKRGRTLTQDEEAEIKRRLNELRLTADEKALYKEWNQDNAEVIFRDVIEHANVIIIDDYQPSAMIPFIKNMNEDVKIIYRSHIQLQGELIDAPGTTQEETWDFIWNDIADKVDVFISHPIDNFIPGNVPEEKVLLMPATTDPLDGLNKPLTTEQMEYYIDVFNHNLSMSGQTALENSRPYIIQVARFDPAKGIPDVIDAYCLLRERMMKEGTPLERVPQLVIVGHGAVDDPEGAPIFQETRGQARNGNGRHGACIDKKTHEIMETVSRDIKIARLPHNDQVLNALLRGSKIGLQLSHAEGCEIKVTEGLDKGKPFIAYRAGGIPLQIRNGVNGFLVEKIGDVEKVAEHMFDLLTDDRMYMDMSSNARTLRRHAFWTAPQVSNWLYLIRELYHNRQIRGSKQTWVRSLVDKDFEDHKKDNIQNQAKKDINNIHQRSDRLFNAIERQMLAAKGGGYSHPVDIQIDLSLISPDENEVKANAKTLALLILRCRSLDNVNFIFSNGFPLLKGKSLLPLLKREVKAGPRVAVFRRYLEAEIRIAAEDFFEDKEAIVRKTYARVKAYDASRYKDLETKPIEIPFISKELALWMRENSEALDPGQFPVVMGGIVYSHNNKVPLRNFEAGFMVGLAKAALVIDKKRIERNNDNKADAQYVQLKKDIVLRLNDVYEIAEPRIRFDENTLEYIVDEDPVQRLNRAIESYLPAIIRIPVEYMRELHEHVQLLLHSA